MLGARPFLGLRDTGSGIRFPQALSCIREEPVQHQSARDPCPPRSDSLLSLATSPKSIPLLALGKALPVCGRVSKKDT